MNERSPEERTARLEERTKALFDESVENLSPSAVARLASARRKALREAKDRRSPGAWRVWMPAAALTAAAVVAVVLLRPEAVDEPKAPVAALTAQDITIVLDEDGIEFLEELEFYAWLDSESAALEAEPGAAPAEPRRS